MRAKRGFTLIELMVVVAITAIVAALVAWQGRSARQAATLAGGAYELTLRMSGLKARAMANARDYLLVVVDVADADGCEQTQTQCGRVVILRNPDSTFSLSSFDPDSTVSGAEFDDTDPVQYLPKNSMLDLGSAWKPPPPFNSVSAWTGGTKCSGRPCFAIRFRQNGEVAAEPPVDPPPKGFAFVLKPHTAPSAAAERRGVFVSFPAGIVKTAAF